MPAISSFSISFHTVGADSGRKNGVREITQTFFNLFFREPGDKNLVKFKLEW